MRNERNVEAIELLNTATTHKNIQGLEYNFPLVRSYQVTHTKEEKDLVKKLKKSVFTESDVETREASKRRRLRLKIDYHFKHKN